ncbi:hypothetical protein ADIAL_1980 [Alkalibacterium sp. AK22]|uniref:FliO/MopB family protein n=1 Tax=Alkalibacterium sp. AK22 TaxID=1229520 RepID=UPI0004479272|nr:flagellar biosynthetic protein FliO [Alkalibacterium sp. AK22]EXJ22394.1 hypothetical protein ADIAL_1980 [Alkalibacterium sp. AK22]
MDLNDLLQMILALILIVFLANFLLKKLNHFQQPAGQVITIIERVQMSKASSICIVQVGTEYMLMSVSDSQNELLKTFTPEEKEAIQQKLAQKQSAAKVFKSEGKAEKLIGLAGSQYKNMKAQYADFREKGKSRR